MPGLFSIHTEKGDIARRTGDTYVPSFYRSSDLYRCLVDFLAVVAPSFDRYLELSKALPDLQNVYLCPNDLLRLLGNLVGYEWRTDVEIGAQRRYIEGAADDYKIKGTVQSILGFVRRSGARRAEIRVPFDSVLTLSEEDSTVSGDDYLPGRQVYRPGTYELLTDVTSNVYTGLPFDHPKDRTDQVLGRLQAVTPAGTKVLPRYHNDFRATMPKTNVVNFSISEIARVTMDYTFVAESVTGQGFEIQAVGVT